METKKDEGYNAPPAMPAEGAPEESTEMSRLDALEANVEKILALLQAKTASEKPIDEKEGVKPDVKEKKKEGSGEKVTLPKSPAGETDETAKPDTDHIKLMAKMDEKFAEFAKSLGISKTTTPRPEHNADIAKSHGARKNEVALDMIKRAKEGKITAASMNMEIKDLAKSSRDAQLQKMLDAAKEAM